MYLDNDHYTSGERIWSNFVKLITRTFVCMCVFFTHEYQFGLSIISNYRRSCRDNCSQERKYEKLIHCHCFGSNLALVYNLRCSSLRCNMHISNFHLLFIQPTSQTMSSSIIYWCWEVELTLIYSLHLLKRTACFIRR